MKAETEALVYEITKENMELLLDKRPEIAERLTRPLPGIGCGMQSLCSICRPSSKPLK